MYDVDFLESCLDLSLGENSSLEDEYVECLSGYSSLKVKSLLNNICNKEDIRYLEIGLFKGSTFLSSLFKNGGIKRAIGIDLIVNDVFKDLLGRFYPEDDRVEIYQCNSWDFDTSIIGDDEIDVYFYDGGHSLEDQEKALTYYDRCLKKRFVYIVDDYNDDRVIEGTDSAIDKMGYKVLLKKELFTPNKRNCSKCSWWNGIGLFLLEKQDN